MEILQHMLFGTAAGLLMYLSGVGGGVLVVPSLIVLFGLEPVLAVGTASVFSFVFKVGAGWSHGCRGHVSAGLLRMFLPVALAACTASAAMVSWLHSTMADHQSLDLVLQCLTVSAGLMAWMSLHINRWEVMLQRLGLPALAATSGVLVGATGTGGGVLVTPALLSVTSESAKTVVGTSLVIGLALSGVTSLAFGVHDAVAWRVAVAVCAGGLIALLFGPWVFQRLSPVHIRRLTSTLIGLALLGLVSQMLKAHWA